jgi:hypothetical protein
VVNLPAASLDRYVGKYRVTGEATTFTVSRRDRQLYCDFQYNPLLLELVPHSEREFSLRWTAGEIAFDLRPDGRVAGLTFRLGGETRTYTRVD